MAGDSQAVTVIARSSTSLQTRARYRSAGVFHSTASAVVDPGSRSWSVCRLGGCASPRAGVHEGDGDSRRCIGVEEPASVVRCRVLQCRSFRGYVMLKGDC